jgi:diguanylate cyclase (GGDEF)-like protein
VRAVQGVLEVRRERQQKQVAEMSQKLETLGSQLEIARRESTTDGLTHLFNSRAFDDQLPRCAELARLRSIGAALLIIDVDHFKKVNDTWGHPAGDAVLRSIAHETIRVFKRKGDFVARYGGEELAVLLTDVDYRETTSQAEKVRGAIAQMPLAWEGAVLNVTASVGGALWRADEPNEAWLARADAALYAAKHTGRNRVSISE